MEEDREWIETGKKDKQREEVKEGERIRWSRRDIDRMREE